MLQGIWKHYNYSPKAVRELKELAESMQVRAYKAVKADGTRWVPHLKRALDCSSFEELLHSSKSFAAHLASTGCKYNNARQSFQLLQKVSQLQVPAFPQPAP